MAMSRFALAALLAALAVGPLGAGSAVAEAPAHLYLLVDRSLVLDLTEPARKVAVANPNVADVQVISPTQLLIIGKGTGITSLVVFSSKAPRYFDLVVHPTPVATPVDSSRADAPYAVLVQRGGAMSEQLFTRDKDQRWLDLGTMKSDPDTGKK